jgi:hypothetical protein
LRSCGLSIRSKYIGFPLIGTAPRVTETRAAVRDMLIVTGKLIDVKMPAPIRQTRRGGGNPPPRAE